MILEVWRYCYYHIIGVTYSWYCSFVTVIVSPLPFSLSSLLLLTLLRLISLSLHLPFCCLCSRRYCSYHPFTVIIVIIITVVTFITITVTIIEMIIFFVSLLILLPSLRSSSSLLIYYLHHGKGSISLNIIIIVSNTSPLKNDFCPREKVLNDITTDYLLYIIDYSDVIMSRWRLKSPALRLFTQSFIQVQIKENIKAPRHWPLCGEFTGTGEFPAQMASDMENFSIWWRRHVYVLFLQVAWPLPGTPPSTGQCKWNGKFFWLTMVGILCSRSTILLKSPRLILRQGGDIVPFLTPGALLHDVYAQRMVET